MARARNVDGPRTRAARTKRERSRSGLLAAAEAIFTRKGWARTRIEDVAQAAGVSVPTVYQHFRSKHALMGHVYGPRVVPRVDRARARLAAGDPVTEILEDHIRGLAAMTRENQRLTAALVSAVDEYTAKVGGGPPDLDDDADPRAFVPLPDGVVELIRAGQKLGEFRPFPTAREFGPQLTNILLLRGITRPDETSTATAEMILTIAFGVLQPRVLVESGFTGRPFAR